MGSSVDVQSGPGARPQRAWSRRELVRLERSRKRVDALMLAFSAWMADRFPRPLRPITRRQYVGAVRRAFTIAEKGNHSLLAADIRTVRFVLGSVPANPSTQNGMISALRAFFEFCKAQGMRKNNPAAELGRPPRLKTIPRPLTIEDICLYLDAAYELGVNHAAVACFGLYMGLRSSEIQHLGWADFFEADGRLWCDVNGKGGKRARMYVHAECAKMLGLIRREHTDPTWLFPSSRIERAGLCVSTNWPRDKHHQILDTAGLPREATLHRLRHSFATYLRRTGVDIAVVKEGLRHANLSSTEIYTAVLPEELATAMDGLHFDQKKEEADGEDGRSSSEAG